MKMFVSFGEGVKLKWMTLFFTKLPVIWHKFSLCFKCDGYRIFIPIWNTVINLLGFRFASMTKETRAQICCSLTLACISLNIIGCTCVHTKTHTHFDLVLVTLACSKNAHTHTHIHMHTYTHTHLHTHSSGSHLLLQAFHLMSNLTCTQTNSHSLVIITVNYP